jgi:hypothetical protein
MLPQTFLLLQELLDIGKEVTMLALFFSHYVLGIHEVSTTHEVKVMIV